MLDIGAALLSSAIKVVETLVEKWIEKKVTTVRTTDINKQMSQIVKDEADRIRLRVSDLEAESKRIWAILLPKMPEFEVKKPLIGAGELKINYNPDAEYSGAQLLANLRKRVAEIEGEYCNNQNINSNSAQETGVSSLFVPVDEQEETTTNSMNHSDSISAKMLQELQKRVSEREEPRQ